MTEITDRDLMPEETGEEDTLKDRYLMFSLGDENYGIEIRYVTEIASIQKITEMPELPQYFKGILNLRGRIVPIMDARIRFGKDSVPYNDRSCIIVFSLDGMLIGLVVDSVSDVATIPERNIVDLSIVSREFQNRFIQKVAKNGKEMKMLIDCRKLLSEEDHEDIRGCIDVQD